jgi:hypothetical protein
MAGVEVEPAARSIQPSSIYSPLPGLQSHRLEKSNMNLSVLPPQKTVLQTGVVLVRRNAKESFGGCGGVTPQFQPH